MPFKLCEARSLESSTQNVGAYATFQTRGGVFYGDKKNRNTKALFVKLPPGTGVIIG